MKKAKWQQGISLVEILAAIVIVSLIIILIFSIISNGQNQYSKQNVKNQDQQNITYAMKVLTKEIRQNPENITVTSNNEIIISGVTYKKSGTSLIKDLSTGTEELAKNIKDFEVVENSNTITIKLVSSSGEEVSTQIVKRS